MIYSGKHNKLLESMGFDHDSHGNIIIEDAEIMKLIEKLSRVLGDNSALQYQMKNYNDMLDKLHHYEEAFQGDYSPEERAKYGYRAG